MVPGVPGGGCLLAPVPLLPSWPLCSGLGRGFGFLGVGGPWLALGLQVANTFHHDGIDRSSKFGGPSPEGMTSCCVLGIVPLDPGN